MSSSRLTGVWGFKATQATHSHTLIEIDGGVNFETGRELFAAGANALVAGSFVFKSEDPEATIAGLKNLKTE